MGAGIPSRRVASASTNWFAALTNGQARTLAWPCIFNADSAKRTSLPANLSTKHGTHPRRTMAVVPDDINQEVGSNAPLRQPSNQQNGCASSSGDNFRIDGVANQ